MIPQGAIDSYTKVVLVNAIYFKGKWAIPFDKNNTQNQPFYTTSNGCPECLSPVAAPVTVAMMHLESQNISYYSNTALQAVRLDYAGGNLSMVILLPTSNSTLSQVESGLSQSEISNILSNFRTRDVQIWLPRFNITTPSMDMIPTLESLGINSVFNNANFSRLTNASLPLNITGVYQKAFIQVDEQGTEAAAATGVIIGVNAAPIVEKPVQFNADHPFLYLIVDNQNGAILFMGSMANPLGSNPQPV